MQRKIQSVGFFLAWLFNTIVILLRRRIVVSVSGLPGAGKDYAIEGIGQSLRVYGVTFIGCSAVINRAAQDPNHPYHRHCVFAQECIRKSVLVPDWLVLAVMTYTVRTQPSWVRVVVTNGFPRTPCQVYASALFLAGVVLVQVTDEAALANMAKRAYKAVASGKSPRPDDTSEGWKARLRDMKEKEAACLVVYSCLARLFRRTLLWNIHPEVVDQGKIDAVYQAITSLAGINVAVSERASAPEHRLAT